MNLDCEFEQGSSKIGDREGANQSLYATRGDGESDDTDVQLLNESPTASRQHTGAWAPTNQHLHRERTMLKVKDLSRLWAYRNGRSPPRRSTETE